MTKSKPHNYEKITKEQIRKLRKTVERELGLQTPVCKTGPHKTEKDKPRKRIKIEDLGDFYD
jgi:hypothetical protein